MGHRVCSEALHRCYGGIYNLIKSNCQITHPFLSPIYRDIVPYGIFMLVYEYSLEKLRNKSSDQTNTKMHFREDNVNPLHSAIAGSIAGVLSWAPVLQFDTVKTRMMTETDPKRFRNLWHCFSVIIAVRNLTFSTKNIVLM